MKYIRRIYRIYGYALFLIVFVGSSTMLQGFKWGTIIKGNVLGEGLGVSSWLIQQMARGVYKPEVLAFLDMVAYAEGTFTLKTDGYRSRFPGKMVDTLIWHPNQVECITYKGKPLCATAAGRYMFLYKTWKRCAEALSLQDFGHVSQDRAAIYLLEFECDVMKHIHENSPIEKIITSANEVWATLPGSPYGQPERALEEVRYVFRERLAYYEDLNKQLVAQMLAHRKKYARYRDKFKRITT